MGGAAAARWVAVQLMPVLFVLSLALLGYAHYRVWWLRTGHRAGRVVLWINTALMAWLWYDRVANWLRP